MSHYNINRALAILYFKVTDYSSHLRKPAQTHSWACTSCNNFYMKKASWSFYQDHMEKIWSCCPEAISIFYLPFAISLHLPWSRPFSSLSDASQTFHVSSLLSCHYLTSLWRTAWRVYSRFLSTGSMAVPGFTSLSLHPFISHGFFSRNLCFSHTGPPAVPYTCSEFLNLSSLFLPSLFPGMPSLFLISIHVLYWVSQMIANLDIPRFLIDEYS